MRNPARLRTSLLALIFIAAGACSDRNKGQPSTQAVATDSTRGGAAQFEPLPPELAFALKVDSVDRKTLRAVISPAPDHYLYKSRLAFTLKNATGVQLEAVTLPPGIPKRDPFLGDQDIYRHPVNITLPLARATGVPAAFTLVASYQGCNEKIGLCYAPIETTLDFILP